MVDSPRLKIEGSNNKNIKKRDLAREVEQRLRNVQEQARVVTDGLRNGDICLEDLYGE